MAVVAATGRVFGSAFPSELLESAREALRAGRSTNHIFEHEGSRFLLDAWVPEPRPTVVGGGELLDATRRPSSASGLGDPRVPTG